MAERLPIINSSSSDDFGGVPPSHPRTTVNSESAEVEVSARQRRLWSLFQHTATSLTNLYKCKSSKNSSQHTEDQDSWMAFQSTSASLTSLYRESAEILASLERSKMAAADHRMNSKNIVNNSDVKPLSNSSDFTNSSTVTSSAGTQAGFGTSPDDVNAVMNTMATFDFLQHHTAGGRLKRSWSPPRGWPPHNDDDMDHFGAKKRRFL